MNSTTMRLNEHPYSVQGLRHRTKVSIRIDGKVQYANRNLLHEVPDIFAVMVLGIHQILLRLAGLDHELGYCHLFIRKWLSEVSKYTA
jgi:hypothetical protein